MEPIKEPKPLVLVSSFPHMHCGLTISKSMREVILALVPAVLASVYYFRVDAVDRKSTRLNSSHSQESRMPSSA